MSPASALGRLSIALLTYSTRPRGGVVHTLALAEALARAGQDVTVWSLARGGDAEFFRPVDHLTGSEVRLVPGSSPTDGDGEAASVTRILRSISTPWRAAFTARDRGYDVVHAQDCISANAVPECIRTVHHLDHFTTPELVACHETRDHPTVRTHVCVSARRGRRTRRTAGGIKASVIPNGVDARRRFARAAARRSRGTGRDPAGLASDRLGRYLLTVGGIEPRKGSIDLLDAYALLRRVRPGTSQLVIAGGETLFDYRDYRARWEARAKELGLDPIVLGPVADPELPGLVAAAEAFAFPSTKEGFGMAALEALAAGVPLVTSDLPVFRALFGAVAILADSPEGLARGLAEAIDRPGPGPAGGGPGVGSFVHFGTQPRRICSCTASWSPGMK